MHNLVGTVSSRSLIKLNSGSLYLNDQDLLDR